MKRTKSLVALLLAVALIFMLVACTNGDDTTQRPPDDTNDPIDSGTDTNPPETDPPETDPPVTDPSETDPPVTDPPKPVCSHEYDAGKTVEATCSTEGGTVYTCKKCGATKTENVVPKTEHKYVQLDVTAATCTEGGEVGDTCVWCGNVQNKRKTEALGHDYTGTKVVEAVSPTYHTAEITYCTRCQEQYSVKGAEKHSFTLVKRVADQTTSSGFTTYGFEIFECSCGYSMTVSANHADGHFYEKDAVTGKYVCACGDRLVGDLADNGNPNAGPDIFK